jgi:cystathionine beta-lyase/cystathionine gamma-synthase
MTQRDGDRAPLAGGQPVIKPPWPADDPLEQPGFETVCGHFAEDPASQFGAAVPPIHQTSTFIYPDAAAFERRLTGQTQRFDYSRGANPTVQILEAKLARLENGAWCDAFASGMGAISAAINACVQADAHIVAVAQCYAPTRWYLDHLRRFRIETTYVNSVDPQAFIDAVRPNTRVIHLESPTSGRFDVPKVEPIARFARQRGIVTIFDNSWASPYFCSARSNCAGPRSIRLPAG